MSVIDEAIRFSEEYGYNRWQEARDELTSLRKEHEELRWLENLQPTKYLDRLHEYAAEIARLREENEKLREDKDWFMKQAGNMGGHVGTLLAALRGALYRLEQMAGGEDMCPNCVTPWKCNGPHTTIEDDIRAAISEVEGEK